MYHKIIFNLHSSSKAELSTQQNNQYSYIYNLHNNVPDLAYSDLLNQLLIIFYNLKHKLFRLLDNC